MRAVAGATGGGTIGALRVVRMSVAAATEGLMTAGAVALATGGRTIGALRVVTTSVAVTAVEMTAVGADTGVRMTVVVLAVMMSAPAIGGIQPEVAATGLRENVTSATRAPGRCASPSLRSPSTSRQNSWIAQPAGNS